MDSVVFFSWLVYFFYLVALSIVIGNSLVIVVIRRYTSLQTITNRLLFSLACSDVMAGLFVCWQSAFIFNPELDEDDTACVSRFIQFQPSLCSIMHLLDIAIDRYLAVLHPLRYHHFMTVRVSNVMIALSWLTSIAQTSTIMGTARFIEGESVCMVPDIMREDVLIGVLHVPFTLVALSMCTLYMRIMLVARKQSVQIRALDVWAPDQKTKSFAKELKAAKQLSLIVLVFLARNSLYFVASLLGYGYQNWESPKSRISSSTRLLASECSSTR